MLFAGKTESGTRLWPRWWCFLFGGNFRQLKGGYGWSPGVGWLTYRYFKEDWYSRGNSYVKFISLKG